MPDIEPNENEEEPDEELPFPIHDLSEINVTPKWVKSDYESLANYLKSVVINNRHLRKENQKHYERILILNADSKAREDIEEIKLKWDVTSHLLDYVAGIVATVGVTVAFTLRDTTVYIILGLFLIICGLILACFNYLLHSKRKQRRDDK